MDDTITGMRYIDKDITRIFAIFLVIFGPRTAYFVMMNPTLVSNADWLINVIYLSFSVIAVPLLVMVSGSLLLPKHEDWRIFYKKRFIKIFIPFVVWILIYTIWRIYYHHDNLSVLEWVKRIAGGDAYYHLWFLYMLLILYVFTPLLRKLFIRFQSKMHIVLFGWFLLCSLTPSLIFLINMSFGLTLPNLYGTIEDGGNYIWLLLCYTGYFMLGGYLNSKIFTKKQIFLSWMGAIVCPLVTSYLTYAITNITGKPTSFKDLFFFTILLAAGSTFILIQHYFRKHDSVAPKLQAELTQLSSLCFGIYLVHPIIIALLLAGKLNINPILFNPIIATPVVSVIRFAASAVFSWIVSHIPILKYAIY